MKKFVLGNVLIEAALPRQTSVVHVASRQVTIYPYVTPISKLKFIANKQQIIVYN